MPLILSIIKCLKFSLTLRVDKVVRSHVSSILDALTKGVQEKAPCCMKFADDVILVKENTQALEDKIER